ncbi:YqgE/AlgH family protein [Phaeovibrio sulfidiphilus]|uniref:UPF0301 protein IHV25_01940 n=1 Tax=Phaeovibrio sulfidiphilus TaxID=1220600 RepID=A0A8J6YKR1_9PROT|nr:YqgE/AlgH family protein [Phaeovibrio sulfidiphilus]MBE1236415.1 YqgE/AlgH family protein [Phaeovibrio sulfidiphilus]
MITKTSTQTLDGYLTGQCLVAMPGMGDPRFEGAVVYLCSHSADGAMGLVINKTFEDITFPEMMDQLGIALSASCKPIQIQLGGPVETGRGFVLHTLDYHNPGTLSVDDVAALTVTLDVLRAIASGEGPRQLIMALGYAGWSAGQLDSEIRDNVWLTVPADHDLLFDLPLEDRYLAAMARIGVHPHVLSEHAGHA